MKARVKRYKRHTEIQNMVEEVLPQAMKRGNTELPPSLIPQSASFPYLYSLSEPGREQVGRYEARSRLPRGV